MGPKAAGLSRSMGGADWSPWPWPLSAQAGPYLSLFLIPDSHSRDSADASASDRPAPQSRLPYPLAEPKIGVRTGVGLVNNHYLASGWTYMLTHACVCVSYDPIIDTLL